jgi:hypothetical protein
MRAVSVVLIAVACNAEREASVLFESELWPGEGRPVFEAVGGTLPVRRAPSAEAPILQHLEVDAGQRLSFDSTRYRTVSSGALVATEQVTVTGRDFGPIHHLPRARYYARGTRMVSVPVAAGDTVEYLQYRAEGTCFVRMGGRVIDTRDCPTRTPGRWIVVQEPVLEWWIRILIDGGPVGWLLTGDSTAKVVGRTF